MLTSAIPVAIIGDGAVLDYISGRTFALPLANFLPLVCGGALLMLASWTVGAATLAAGLRAKQTLLKLGILESSMLLCGAIFALCLQLRPYLVTLRSAVFVAGTADEFRNAAEIIHAILEPDTSPFGARSWLPGPAKCRFGTKRDRRRWNEVITRAPCLRRLRPSVWIFRHDTYVSFAWGGALVGHWEFNVGRDAPGGHFETLRVDDDFHLLHGALRPVAAP